MRSYDSDNKALAKAINWGHDFGYHIFGYKINELILLGDVSSKGSRLMTLQFLSMLLTNYSSDQVVQCHALRQKLAEHSRLALIAQSTWHLRTEEQQKLVKQDLWTALVTVGLMGIQRSMIIYITIFQTAVTSDPRRTSCSLKSI